MRQDKAGLAHTPLVTLAQATANFEKCGGIVRSALDLGALADRTMPPHQGARCN